MWIRSACWRALLLTTIWVIWGCESGGQVSRKRPESEPAVASATATTEGRSPAPAEGKAEDWNDGQIQWMGYDEGLAAAKAQHKPVCLIFYTEWCPHCRNYRTVFQAPAVVEKARQFVMIRLDKDKNRVLSAKYAPDGEYIPRTLFLAPDGTIDESIHAPRAQYRYFYDEGNPVSLLAGMDEALRKLR